MRPKLIPCLPASCTQGCFSDESLALCPSANEAQSLATVGFTSGMFLTSMLSEGNSDGKGAEVAHVLAVKSPRVHACPTGPHAGLGLV